MENAEMSLVLHDSENGCLATLAADVETYRQGGGKRLKTIELTGEIPVMHRMVKEICFDLSDGDRIRELIFRRSLLERFPCVGRLTVLREAGGFFSADGVLMARERMDDGAEMVALVRYPAAREHRSYTVPPCVQKIERGAFSRLLYLRELEEEDPSLKVYYDEETREIRLSLMGQVQQQVVKKLMEDFRR